MGKTFWLTLISILSITYVFWVIQFNCIYTPTEQYTVLSKSFLLGSLSFPSTYVHEVGGWDMTARNGKYYWPLGPLPAVLMMPISLLGSIFGFPVFQGILNIMFALLAWLACYTIGRRLGYTREDSLYWALAFCSGTMFIGVALTPKSWYLGNTMATALTLLAIAEYLGKKRFWVIGVMLALVSAARNTAGLGIIFFVLATLFDKQPNPQEGKKVAALVTPFIIMVFLLGLYNYFRFGSFFESGYKNQIIIDTHSQNILAIRQMGLFSIKHIPRNLYYFLLNGPQVLLSDKHTLLPTHYATFDPRGMSVFVTSPWLLGAFLLKYKQRIYLWLLATAAVIAAPILLWYSTGCTQFGYRLALDFLPYVFLAFIIAYKDKMGDLSARLKTVLVLSAAFNTYLIFMYSPAADLPC